MKTFSINTKPFRNNFWGRLILLSPVLISLIVILPRLMSPQFGLFDDPVTISTMRSIDDGTWSPSIEALAGRFRPLYWIYYFIIYLIVDTRPFGFFLGNAFLYMGSTLFIILYTKRSGGTKIQSWFAGLLFALAGPVIENYYTLSKGEGLQLFFITLAMLLPLQIMRTGRNIEIRKVLIFTTASMLIAFSVKETSLIMVPISLAWFLGAYVKNRLKHNVEEGEYRIRKYLFFAVLIGATIYLTWRMFFLPFGLTDRGYPSAYIFNLERIISSARIWLDWLLRDFFYLVPLGIFPILLVARKQKLPNSLILTDMLIWIIAWIGVFLPWLYQAGYYLLPLTVGISILGGILAGQVLEYSFNRRNSLRILTGILFLLFIFFLLLTIPNNITDAKLQLIIDKTNTEMIDTLVTQLPEESILLINLQYANQYVWDLETAIRDVYGRKDITVTNFQFQDLGELATPNSFIFILSPHLYNQYYPSIRLGVFEHYMREWNPSMLEYIGDDYEIIYKNERSIQLTLVDPLRIICPPIRKKITFCQVPNTPFDLQTLIYGWTLYRVSVMQEK
jgi:hypothetical protein